MSVYSTAAHSNQHLHILYGTEFTIYEIIFSIGAISIHTVKEAIFLQGTNVC